MKYQTIFISFLLLFIISTIQSLSGTISEPTEWTDDVWIDEILNVEDTLTIHPGVSVFFSTPNATIVIGQIGKLNATGLPDNRILFVSQNENPISIEINSVEKNLFPICDFRSKRKTNSND